MIRAVIIDDEYLARQRVMKLLEPYEDIKVIGEAKNGSHGLEVIEMKEPDLVFLDVQMPDIDGFEVIKKMQPKQKPYIVFTTAYDAYAIKAFNVHALDYLLKPIDEDRFNESITKITSHFKAQKLTQFNKKLLKMLKDFEEPEGNFTTQITITDRGLEHHIDMDEVMYMEANGNYIGLITATKTYLYRSTMNMLVTRLNPEDFIRIHRSTIVNKRFVKACSYQNNNEYQFEMKNGSILLSGRSYKRDIVAYLSQT